MPLQYPNARLFLHQLLAGDRLSGSQAIAEGACQFGLISHDCALELVPQPDDHSCHCSETVKNVIKKHFEQRAAQAAWPVVNHEEVWSAIENHFESRLQGAPLQSGFESESTKSARTCSNHAPALFDVMLQQIMRYP